MNWDETEQTGQQDGKKFIHLGDINIISKTGTKKIDKNIYAISDKETRQHKVIGTAEGETIGHCVYLGHKYGGKDFFDRVFGYQRVKPKERKMAVALTFYEKKPE